MENAIRIKSRLNSALEINAIPGHFATSHSHINYYVGISKMKHEHMVAREAGITLANNYAYVHSIDTIVCMDGSEVIGGFLAQKLSKNDMLNYNRQKNIYVITPEINNNGQLIFRDNLEPMVRGKDILLLIASITTGRTAKHALQCIKYYGGVAQGIAAVFSTVDEINGLKVAHLFSTSDIPNYETYSAKDCPHCAGNEKLDGLANSFGISRM